MIQPEERWYHYLMVPMPTQVIITVSSVVVILVQFGFYAIMDVQTEKFNDECKVVLGLEKEDGTVIQGAVALCGEHQRSLEDLESEYLYLLLTSEQPPAIVCKQEVSKYFEKESWTCNFKNQSENE